MSDMAPKIRACRPGDVDEIVRLAILMGLAGPAAEVGDRARRICAAEYHFVGVAEAHGRVIGYAWAQDYGPHLRSGEAIVRIHDLFVDPDERRRGAGAALFSHVRDWASERGATYLQWQASHDAIPFYRALGHIGDPCPDPDHPFF